MHQDFIPLENHSLADISSKPLSGKQMNKNTVICLVCLPLTQSTIREEQCFAESPFETQIDSRNHLAQRSRHLSGTQLKCLSI